MGEGHRTRRGWAGLETAPVQSLQARGVPSRCGGSFPCCPGRSLACGRISPLLPERPPLSLSGACLHPCELSPCLRHIRKDSLSKQGHFLRSLGPCEDGEPVQGLTGEGHGLLRRAQVTQARQGATLGLVPAGCRVW